MVSSSLACSFLLINYCKWCNYVFEVSIKTNKHFTYKSKVKTTLAKITDVQYMGNDFWINAR